MNLPDIERAGRVVADLADQYAQHVAVGAGAIGAIIATYAIRRFTRHQHHDDLAANLGVLLFGIVTTEGMWEVVHNKLGVNIPLTIAMFAAFDVVIYSQGRLAIRKLLANPKARVGTYLAIIWCLSAAASLTVSTAGGNTTTQLFRLFSPLVAAALWTQKVLELRTGIVDRVESNWIWTPTRLMIRWGWLKPGAANDLTETFRQRRITALVDAGLELYVQQQAVKLHADDSLAKASRWPWRRRSPLVAARRRVQQLTKTADQADVVAARKQLRLTLNIERELFRDDDEPTGQDRQALDDIRLITRRAADQIRVDHARAFGTDHRTIGGIRMPVHIADQIPDQVPPRWVDQHRTIDPDQSRTNRVVRIVDQAANPTGGPTPDQAPTSVIPAAVRPALVQRTTVLVDQTRPVSPAPTGDIPPRIQEMAAALAQKYQGDIPARSVVMQAMGWTSADYTGKAIKLVRAARTNRTNDTAQ